MATETSRVIMDTFGLERSMMSTLVATLVVSAAMVTMAIGLTRLAYMEGQYVQSKINKNDFIRHTT